MLLASIGGTSQAGETELGAALQLLAGRFALPVLLIHALHGRTSPT